jgi:hypothetical protein
MNMEEQLLPIVPFGKYKDKSVLELLADEKYVEWLKQQSWFSTQKQIYNIVVHQTISTTNNSKTPEHNKLQNLFLENNIVENLGNRIIKTNKSCSHKPIKLNSYKIEFEGKFNWDCIIKFYCDSQCLRGRNCCSSEFDEMCIHLFIEIKPILGEDYPCVLRKMKTQIELTKKNHKEESSLESFMYLLIVKEYNSNITPKDTLIKVFNQTNIKIKFINELLDNFTQEKKHVEELQNINPKKQVEDDNLEEENKLLREKLLQAEEKIKQLQEEILSLKSQKQSKSIKDYFGKK